MKTILFSLFAFIASQALSAQKTQEISIRTAVACDHCNACETCKMRVESALFKVKGVKLCEMNAATETIRVVYNPSKTNDVALRNAIAGCGYDADDVKATREGYEQLDGCCRKE